MPHKDLEAKRQYEREYQRKTYERDKERRYRSTVKWRKSHPEVHNATQARYRENNAEKIRERMREIDARPERKRKKAERERKRRAELRAQRPAKEIKPWKTSKAGMEWKVRYNKEYREKNREKLNAYDRTRQRPPEYAIVRERARLNHVFRTRNNGGISTEAQWKARCELYGFCCAYCSSTLVKRVEIDHVIPVAKGGLGWPSNLVPACRKCNARKNAGRWTTHLPKPKGRLP